MSNGKLPFQGISQTEAEAILQREQGRSFSSLDVLLSCYQAELVWTAYTLCGLFREIDLLRETVKNLTTRRIKIMEDKSNGGKNFTGGKG